MMQDHTTAQAMTTRYHTSRPKRRRQTMVRPPGRRPQRQPRPSVRPVESA